MLDRKVLSRELGKIPEREDLVIEKYSGSFAVTKDFNSLMTVRAIIDLESGKVSTSSSIGLLTIVLLVISTLTIAGLIIVALVYLFYIKPMYEDEMRGMLRPAIEKAEV